MKVSVVIPTYNRGGVLWRSIWSAKAALACDLEIIVVDDASTDDTRALLIDLGADIGTLKVIINPRNLGVTASKNIGYTAATGDWVVFLDSDDILLPEAGAAMLDALCRHAGAPIVFFRCQDQDGKFVGQRIPHDFPLDLPTYIAHTSFGEALTVVNKTMVADPPYVADLRGYEGLGCARIIARYGPAVLADVIARQYDTSGNDRLSGTKGMVARMPLLAKGHRQMIAEFGTLMDFRTRVALTVKSAAYSLLGAFLTAPKQSR